MNKEPFASWAKLELMGHLSFTGYVEEVEVFGITMVACTPLDEEGKEGKRRYFGPSSIYSLSPLSEEEARAIITQRQERAVRRQQLLTAPRPVLVQELTRPDEDSSWGPVDDEEAE